MVAEAYLHSLRTEAGSRGNLTLPISVAPVSTPVGIPVVTPRYGNGSGPAGYVPPQSSFLKDYGQTAFGGGLSGNGPITPLSLELPGSPKYGDGLSSNPHYKPLTPLPKAEYNPKDPPPYIA